MSRKTVIENKKSYIIGTLKSINNSYKQHEDFKDTNLAETNDELMSIVAGDIGKLCDDLERCVGFIIEDYARPYKETVKNDGDKFLDTLNSFS